MQVETELNEAEKSPSRERLEQINKDLTFIMNKACKRIEESCRNIPYSAQKVIRRATKQY